MMHSIFKLYPQVVRTVGDEAFDADGNQVTYDLALVQAYEDSIAYIAKRQSEYPPMTDYLDAVVKGDTAQQQAYIDACLAVKAKYPKGVA
jgi:hypothetical protein